MIHPIRPLSVETEKFKSQIKDLSDASELKALSDAIARIERILVHIEDRDKSRATVEREERTAFERFMFGLRDTMKEVSPMVKVKSNVSWIKIESLVNGHKIYISKGKLSVGRVESTMPTWMINGAIRPGFKNGKISSWLPPTVDAVKQALKLLIDPKLKDIDD